MATKRPDWVWVIAIFTFVTAGLSLLTAVALMFLPMDELDAGQAPLTTFDHASAIIFALAGIVAGIYLMRLRKAAFYWYAVPLVAWLALLTWDLVTRGFGEWPRDLEGMLYNLFGLVIGTAICAYCWKLIQRGVLT